MLGRTGRSVKILATDLADKAGLAKAETLLRQDRSITMLVNNAGVASVAPLLQADIAKMDGIIDLNITAPTHLTDAAAPAFVGRGGGTIINISSVVGLGPERLNGVYGASKAYVLALGHSLQQELEGKGLRIQTVVPGATATDIWELAGRPVHMLPQEIVMSAEDMVDAALAGLDQGEQVTIPPLQDGEEWTKFETARRALWQHLGNSKPAPRYGIHSSAAARAQGSAA